MNEEFKNLSLKFWLFTGLNAAILLLSYILVPINLGPVQNGSVFVFIVPVVIITAVVSAKVIYSKRGAEVKAKKLKSKKAFEAYCKALRLVWINITLSNVFTLLVYLQNGNALFIAASASLIALQLMDVPSQGKFEKDF